MLNKVLRRKQLEQEVESMNRLPPGQSLTNKFPVLHYGPTPHTDLKTWDFRVFGLVEEEKVWNWEAFNQLPRTNIMMDLHCVTRWSKFDTKWEGVSVKTLIDEGFIKPKPEAEFVVQHCEYGYTTNTPLELILQDNFLLATHYEGQPIPVEHGWPLRGLIGSFADRSEAKTAYLWKGGKWLRGLEFRATDKLGFWENAGYHNEADPWQEQRFSRGGWF
ncbi:MAG: molybdopterin-dependent oxidoreductase [Ardenticatenaceae bacterium]|nr:molybdopterin-dependent oxidoreductase [Ardenticatenaceae bacterium]